MPGKPWIRVRSIATPVLSQGYISSCDYTTPSQSGSFEIAIQAGIADGTWCPSVYITADDNNSGTVYVGGSGAATYPLAKSEHVTISLPQGNVFDLSKITVDGRGTSGLIVHFFYGVIIPPPRE
jgi:hypothetical protein